MRRARTPRRVDTGTRETSSARVLDPVERASEVLFGVLMVMTVTGSVSVAEHGAADTRSLLAAAIGGNVAWGIVDAVMYLMGNLTERARAFATLKNLRQAADLQRANELVLDALPPVVAGVMTPSEVGGIRERLLRLPDSNELVPLKRTDIAGALGVFLLVALSTVPLLIPFLVMSSTRAALRTSNSIGVAMLFGIGWSLGHYGGQSGWRIGLIMVGVGAALVAITMALGG